ncbi:putative membrane protein [Rhodopirellula maiorica SM1]|uniref:Putative membrane protein n=2 Tax=Novipirellula TaxID=2795426 RepID=M5RT63_9BACT|nr:putative membrane protein [Rhodopirellula maiorica SM1]
MLPAFTLDLPLGKDEAMQRIRQAIAELDAIENAKAAGDCAEFSVRPEERRFWSPHLSVQLSNVETGTQLYARFSPRPEVWTFFMLVYFITAFFMFVGGVYGYVQWFMGAAPWGLVLIPLGGLVIVCLHLASLIGQGLSKDQMEKLRDQLDCTVAFALRSSNHSN